MMSDYYKLLSRDIEHHCKPSSGDIKNVYKPLLRDVKERYKPLLSDVKNVTNRCWEMLRTLQTVVERC